MITNDEEWGMDVVGDRGAVLRGDQDLEGGGILIANESR